MIINRRILHSSFVRYGALPLGLIVLVVVLRLFFFLPFRVMTSAQSPDLRLGAWALARRSHSPKHGDIVLFRLPSPRGRTPESLHLGRIVALPGDSIELRTGRLVVNEEEVHDYRHEINPTESYALRLPREGGVYPITSTNLVAYRSALLEEQKLYPSAPDEVALEGTDPKHWLKALAKNPYHTFRRDYYWVLTDQTQAAPDSRHLGILPADAILGIVLFSL